MFSLAAVSRIDCGRTRGEAEASGKPSRSAAWETALAWMASVAVKSVSTRIKDRAQDKTNKTERWIACKVKGKSSQGWPYISGPKQLEKWSWLYRGRKALESKRLRVAGRSRETEGSGLDKLDLRLFYIQWRCQPGGLGLDTPLGGISVHVVLIVTGMSEIIRRASTKRREKRKGTEDWTLGNFSFYVSQRYEIRMRKDDHWCRKKNRGHVESQ